MLFQKRKKGQVGMFVAFLKDVLKIPSGLVRVDNQDEVKRRVGGGHDFPLSMIPRHLAFGRERW
jgi:hypothetical protein